MLVIQMDFFWTRGCVEIHFVHRDHAHWLCAFAKKILTSLIWKIEFLKENIVHAHWLRQRVGWMKPKRVSRVYILLSCQSRREGRCDMLKATVCVHRSRDVALPVRIVRIENESRSPRTEKSRGCKNNTEWPLLHFLIARFSRHPIMFQISSPRRWGFASTTTST